MPSFSPRTYKRLPPPPPTKPIFRETRSCEVLQWTKIKKKRVLEIKRSDLQIPVHTYAHHHHHRHPVHTYFIASFLRRLTFLSLSQFLTGEEKNNAESNTLAVFLSGSLPSRLLLLRPDFSGSSYTLSFFFGKVRVSCSQRVYF